MIVRGNRYNVAQNIKFGNKIPTKLVEDVKSSIGHHRCIELSNGDSVSSALGHGSLGRNAFLIKRPLPSPDDLCIQTIVQLKKRLFGGFKVASVSLEMKRWSYKSAQGGWHIKSPKFTPLGQTNPKKATKEIQGILERVLQETKKLTPQGCGRGNMVK